MSAFSASERGVAINLVYGASASGVPDVSLGVEVSGFGYLVRERSEETMTADSTWRKLTLAAARRRFHRRLGELVEEGYRPLDGR